MANITIHLNERVDSDIRNITNKYCTDLQLNMRNINSEAKNKGIGKSGVLITIQDKNFYSSLNSLLEELIKLVESKQGELNIKYKEEDLIKAEEVLKQCALNYFYLYRNERDKLRQIFNQDKDEMFENMVSINIVGKIENEFKRLKSNLKLIRDTPEVRGQKSLILLGLLH